MKVIVKSNEYIAIPTNKKSECLYLLGQYVNKETCKIEMDKEQVRKITCIKRPKDSSWSKTITLETEISSYDNNYIILDKEGNLVNVVTEEQFKNQYAILQEKEEK